MKVAHLSLFRYVLLGSASCKRKPKERYVTCPTRKLQQMWEAPLSVKGNEGDGPYLRLSDNFIGCVEGYASDSMPDLWLRATGQFHSGIAAICIHMCRSGCCVRCSVRSFHLQVPCSLRPPCL